MLKESSYFKGLSFKTFLLKTFWHIVISESLIIKISYLVVSNMLAYFYKEKYYLVIIYIACTDPKITVLKAGLTAQNEKKKKSKYCVYLFLLHSYYTYPIIYTYYVLCIYTMQ
jgi:hypothetical protein